MSSVVFMRAVNVGGHKAFRPSMLAGKLAALRVISLGAAGTFVVHADASESQVRKAFMKHMPFETELMICLGDDVVGLVEADPFRRPLPGTDGHFISITVGRPAKKPTLPLYAPERKAWEVAITAVKGCFVATCTRRVEGARLYPNEVVEKQLGVSATTRGWPTILKLRDALEKKPG